MLKAKEPREALFGLILWVVCLVLFAVSLGYREAARVFPAATFLVSLILLTLLLGTQAFPWLERKLEPYLRAKIMRVEVKGRADVGPAELEAPKVLRLLVWIWGFILASAISFKLSIFLFAFLFAVIEGKRRVLPAFLFGLTVFLVMYLAFEVFLKVSL